MPAAVITVSWLIGAPLLAPKIPPIMTLLLVVLLVLPAVAFLQIRHQLRVENIRSHAAVLDRLGLRLPQRRELLTVGAPALACSLLLPGLMVWSEPLIRSTLGISETLSTGWPTGGTLTASTTTALLTLWLVVAVVVGPIVEEVLFRGLLQPLISYSSTYRVLVGKLLFTFYHLWQPWAWPAVFLATLPVAWVRERSNSTLLAASVHIITNSTAWFLLATGVMQR